MKTVLLPSTLDLVTMCLRELVRFICKNKRGKSAWMVYFPRVMTRYNPDQLGRMESTGMRWMHSASGY